MKKLLSSVCILSAIACQPAHAREYDRYELVGYNQPEYIEYDGAHYARIPQENYSQYEPKRYEQPRFSKLTNEQTNNTKLKREIMTTLPAHPYIGIEAASGKNKYKDEDYKFFFNKSNKHFGVFGGLQFNQYVSLEAFYNTGNTKEKKLHATTEFSSVTAKNTIDFNSYGFDLLGYLPNHQNVDIILGVGYGWYKFDATIKGVLYNDALDRGLLNVKLKDKPKDDAIRFTLGAQYLINNDWSLRLLGRYVNFNDGNVINNMIELSLGLRYMF